MACYWYLSKEYRKIEWIIRHFSFYGGCEANIRMYHECEGGMEKSVLRITDWHKGGSGWGVWYSLFIKNLAHYSSH